MSGTYNINTERVSVHTLAVNMDTSVNMIEIALRSIAASARPRRTITLFGYPFAGAEPTSISGDWISKSSQEATYPPLLPQNYVKLSIPKFPI